MEYEEWVEDGLFFIEERLSVLEDILKGIPEKYLPAVKQELVKVHPADVRLYMQNKSVFDGEVPAYPFEGIADLSFEGCGKGELVIPFLFKDAHLILKHNSPVDVEIAGEGWHVKCCNPNRSIKMGAGKSMLFNNSPVYDQLRSLGVPPDELNSFGLRRLYELVAPLGLDLQELEKQLNDDVRKFAVGPEAMGIVFYHAGVLTFVRRENVGFCGATQGRFKASSISDGLSRVVRKVGRRPKGTKDEDRDSRGQFFPFAQRALEPDTACVVGERRSPAVRLNDRQKKEGRVSHPRKRHAGGVVKVSGASPTSKRQGELWRKPGEEDV